MRMDNFIRVSGLFLGGVIGMMFGGKSVVLGVLLAFTVADYVTGLLAGGTTVGLSSKVGFKGIAKKIVIFIVVAVAHGADLVLGSNDMFRDAAIFFYIANEVISILENASRMDVLVPNKLQEAIKGFLKLSGEKSEDEE